MDFIALKMLIGDRAKFIGIVVGLTFASLLITQQSAIVIPKVSLAGQSTERVDTRVLQGVYSFDRGSLPIFVGQQMDVFIEANAAATAAGLP